MLHVQFDVFIENAVDQLASIVAQCGDLLEALFAGENLVGHIQRHIRQLHATGQNDLRGVRVGEQIEFGNRGNITAIEMRAPMTTTSLMP